jgi:hypothetical protein
MSLTESPRQARPNDVLAPALLEAIRALRAAVATEGKAGFVHGGPHWVARNSRPAL